MRIQMIKVVGALALGLAVTVAVGATQVVSERAAPCLNLRSMPGGPALSCQAPGVEVEVLEQTADWGRVALSTGAEGWMALAYLAPVVGGEAQGSSFRPEVGHVASRAPQASPVREAAVPIGALAFFNDIIYDQLDSPAGAGFASQIFDAANATFDCRAGDDFTVPLADIQWNVNGVIVTGAYISGPGLTPTINVEFFNDGGGVPGTSKCSYPGLVAGVDYVDDGLGSLKIVFPSLCLLQAADYWVSVQAVMDSTVGGQWLWAERSVASGAGFAWENPLDGFGTGCVSWTSAAGCGASAPDLLFALTGEVVPVELQTFSVD